MIAKELRDGWWKFVIGALLILLPTFTVSSYEEIKEQANQGFNYSVVTLDENVTTLDENAAELQAPPPVPKGVAGPINPVEYAFSLLSVSYGLGEGSMMMFLAAIFGFSLVSGEMSRGTNFLLLCRPVSHTRILLTKYGVGAGISLFVALLGAIALVVSAGLKGYPLGALSIAGLISSIVLLWLGSLSVLGLATLTSVAFRDVVVGAIATPLFLVLIFLGPSLIGAIFSSPVLQNSSDNYPRSCCCLCTGVVKACSWERASPYRTSWYAQ